MYIPPGFNVQRLCAGSLCPEILEAILTRLLPMYQVPTTLSTRFQSAQSLHHLTWAKFKQAAAGFGFSSGVQSPLAESDDWSRWVTIWRVLLLLRLFSFKEDN